MRAYFSRCIVLDVNLVIPSCRMMPSMISCERFANMWVAEIVLDKFMNYCSNNIEEKDRRECIQTSLQYAAALRVFVQLANVFAALGLFFFATCRKRGQVTSQRRRSQNPSVLCCEDLPPEMYSKQLLSFFKNALLTFAQWYMLFHRPSRTGQYFFWNDHKSYLTHPFFHCQNLSHVQLFWVVFCRSWFFCWFYIFKVILSTCVNMVNV